MPSYAQLEQEAAWRAETVPDAIEWFIAEAIKYWKLSPGAVGCKGNNLHLRGAHRSRRWIKTSRYCTNRTYTVSHPDDLAGDENWLVGIDLTLPRAVLLAVCKRLDAAVRAGLIEEVSEWYGNTNGDDRVDGYNNIENRVATSDDSHLWHLHITLKRRFANTRAVLQRLFAILTGDDDMQLSDKIKYVQGPEASYSQDGTTVEVLLGQILYYTLATRNRVIGLEERVGRLEDVDEQALAVALAPLIDAGATPAEVAAAVRAELDKTRLGGS